MLDVSHIPSNTDSTRIFYAQGATTWQTWVKPRGAKFIQIFCVGGGGSGAVGPSAVGSRYGVSGGGAAGVSRALIPAFLIPDTLYIQVALGGNNPSVSGTGATAGNAGGISYVSLQPSTAVANLLLASSNAAAVGGTPVIGASTTGATVFATTTAGFSPLSIFSAIAGPNGSASTSSITEPGNGQSALNGFLVTGGAASGNATPGTATAGGNIAPASVILLSGVSGSAGNPSGFAGNASSGYTIMSPFCSTGGGGGGGTGVAIAVAQGGDAGFGSGGGATGAGQTSQFRRGGRGGDGIVIITTIF